MKIFFIYFESLTHEEPIFLNSLNEIKHLHLSNDPLFMFIFIFSFTIPCRIMLPLPNFFVREFS